MQWAEHLEMLPRGCLVCPRSAHPRVLEAGPQLQVGTEALAWWGFVRGIVQVPAGSTASEPTGGLDLGWAYSVLGGLALVTRCNIAPWVHGGSLGALEYVQEGGQVPHRAQHPAGRWRVLRLQLRAGRGGRGRTRRVSGVVLHGPVGGSRGHSVKVSGVCSGRDIGYGSLASRVYPRQGAQGDRENLQDTPRYSLCVLEA